MSIKSGCAASLVLLGVAMCAGVVYRLLTEIARFDIALILSLMISVAFLGFLILPCLVYLIRGKISSVIAAACALVGTSMMWTFVGFAWLLGNAGMSYFESEFYNALLPLTGLGFFGGIMTTCFAIGYIESTSSHKTRKTPERPAPETEN